MVDVRRVLCAVLVVVLVGSTSVGCNVSRLRPPEQDGADRSSALAIELDRVAQNNGMCEGDWDCYVDDGYYCDRSGASVNCTGKCGLCYKRPSDDGDTSSASTPAPDPGNTSQQGGGPLWLYVAGTVLVVVLVVALLNYDPAPEVQPFAEPSGGAGWSFGF